MYGEIQNIRRHRKRTQTLEGKRRKREEVSEQLSEHKEGFHLLSSHYSGNALLLHDTFRLVLWCLYPFSPFLVPQAQPCTIPDYADYSTMCVVSLFYEPFSNPMLKTLKGNFSRITPNHQWKWNIRCLSCDFGGGAPESILEVKSFTVFFGSSNQVQSSKCQIIGSYDSESSSNTK